MNLDEQLGALEVGVDQLIQAVVAPQAENIPETSANVTAQEAPAASHAASAAAAERVAPEAASAAVDAAESAPAPPENRPPGCNPHSKSTAPHRTRSP